MTQSLSSSSPAVTVTAHPETYAMVVAFLKRRCIPIQRTSDHPPLHTNLYLGEGAYPIPVAIYANGTIMIQGDDESHLRRILVAFRDAVVAKTRDARYDN
jgi:hypothetical protein